MIIITSKIFKNIDDNNYTKKIYSKTSMIITALKKIDDENNYIKNIQKTLMIIITSKKY